MLFLKKANILVCDGMGDFFGSAFKIKINIVKERGNIK